MGQKYSTDPLHWTMDNWAFGVADNAPPVELTWEEISKVPVKYLGGRALANDLSIQQLQHELLTFDDKFKRRFFWRKKNRRSKQADYSNEEYYADDEQYYDGNPQSILEEEEPPLSPIYNESRIKRRSSWECETCLTKNESTDIECRQCQETEERF